MHKHLSLPMVTWGSVLIALSVAVSEISVAEPPNHKQLEAFFQAMRSQTDLSDEYGIDFPKLTWDNIPALLELRESRRILKCHIRNPISSRYELEVYEGIYALWLVEGIRKGCSFPSQNPICWSSDENLTSGMDITEKSQKIIAVAYIEWWKTREKLSQQELAELNPLRKTKYSWR